MLQTINIILSV